MRNMRLQRHRITCPRSIGRYGYRSIGSQDVGGVGDLYWVMIRVTKD